MKELLSDAKKENEKLIIDNEILLKKPLCARISFQAF